MGALPQPKFPPEGLGHVEPREALKSLFQEELKPVKARMEEQEKEIAALRGRNEELEERLTMVEGHNEELEERLTAMESREADSTEAIQSMGRELDTLTRDWVEAGRECLQDGASEMHKQYLQEKVEKAISDVKDTFRKALGE